MISFNIDHVIQSEMESRCAICSPFVRTSVVMTGVSQDFWLGASSGLGYMTQTHRKAKRGTGKLTSRSFLNFLCLPGLMSGSTLQIGFWANKLPIAVNNYSAMVCVMCDT